MSSVTGTFGAFFLDIHIIGLGWVKTLKISGRPFIHCFDITSHISEVGRGTYWAVYTDIVCRNCHVTLQGQRCGMNSINVYEEEKRP